MSKDAATMDAQMIQQISQAVPDPMLYIDGAGQIAAANPAATALYGDWIIGRSHGTVLRQPALLERIATVLSGAEGAETLVERSDQSGMTRYRVRLTGLKTGLLAHYTDITHLSEVSDMRRDFVANVSHELRTPLTSVLGFIETLRGPARNDPQAQDRFLGIMETEALRMNRLISDLLSLSRVEAVARMRPDTPVDLHHVITAAISALRARADDSRHSLEVVIDGSVGEEALIAGDRDQLMQVVINLVENAMKYSEAGSPVTIELKREEGRGRSKGQVLTLCVIDQGCGIDSVHLPRLTERFYRVDTHRSRDVGGTGLGLAIVKHIANRHQGRLKIASELGKGSAVSVQFPAL